ncbi:RNA-directed DNA polymerase from mobile element jockey [Nymphon striatum]|nr:RNA-directed DNA polymerase from mobile element jockey [Nymphon striatum]
MPPPPPFSDDSDEDLPPTELSEDRSKYDEICRLLNDHNPTAMCLQETRLNDTFNTTIRRYSIYRRDLPSEHPAGGVCIIVNNQIPHSSVQLNSSLQAIAVRVSMHKVLTICSIYIPPSSPIIAADVEDLLHQLPAPALICGDFNGHNILWGSRVTNSRGRTIENIILNTNLCLYNDTSMTYLDLSAGTYSALDLTLCHPSLLQDFTWMVDGDLHTSDHFPIHVKGNGPPIKGRPQRWKLHKADWTMFKQLCAEQLNISSLAEISDQYSEFITILHEVAEISIPKTSQYPKRFNKPWFNKDCKDAVRERKRLLRKFSLRPTSDNLSSYRQAAAAARRTIRQAKRESWRQYVSKLNSQSSIKSAWDRLRKIRGKGTSDAYKHLNVGGTAITSQFGIANALGQSFFLKSKCLRALNLLRILSNTNWGADRKVMLRFYRSLIRSKLDYGSVVYGSARKSYLRVLDPVHNQGLRLSLGAFRTTPAESLYVEAHEPSLYLRREKLSLQYACRLRANPENPCYDVTFHPNHRETFARRQSSIPTFGLRVLPLFEQIGLPLGNIARCVLPSIPPWTMHRPIINFSLTGLKKGTTPSYVYLYKFLEVSDSYHGYHHIYTDGSRQNDEVAAAAISSLTSLSSRLPDKSSIFSAESKALLLALDIVENSTYGRYIILSDSLSCLMALDNMKYSHPTICDILVKLHLLTKTNHVIFCWLPSHVGISGNEKADFAAKSALSLPVDPQSIYFHDFYMYIFKHTLSIWQSKWDGEINNKLHAIKPKLGEWALSYRKSRKEESILCRLRVGHTYLTHSFLLRNEAQPVCGRCQQTLTVRHVLVDCAALTSVRSRFYSPLPWEEFFEEVLTEIKAAEEGCPWPGCFTGENAGPAQSPNCNRYVEAIMVKLCARYPAGIQRYKDKTPRFSLVMKDYRSIREMVTSNKRVEHGTGLQLFDVNTKTISSCCFTGENAGPAHSPNCNRYVETMMVKLCARYPGGIQRDNVKTPRFSVVMADYRSIREMVISNKRLEHGTGVQLFDVNTKIISSKFLFSFLYISFSCFTGENAGPAQSPNCNRYVEAIMVKLCARYPAGIQRDKVKTPRFYLVMKDYRSIREMVTSNKRVEHGTGLQLFDVNTKTISSRCTHREESGRKGSPWPGFVDVKTTDDGFKSSTTGQGPSDSSTTDQRGGAAPLFAAGQHCRGTQANLLCIVPILVYVLPYCFTGENAGPAHSPNCNRYVETMMVKLCARYPGGIQRDNVKTPSFSLVMADYRSIRKMVISNKRLEHGTGVQLFDVKGYGQ